VPLENGVPADPPGYELSIEYLGHKDTLHRWTERYRDLNPQTLRNGEAFALERVHLSTHNGTHVDAPWHYASSMTNGEPSAKIDEMPLEWFLGRGVKLDFRRFPDGYVVTAADVDEELGRIEHTLEPFDIVLVNTSAGKKYGLNDYVDSGCGMGREATLYLLERGVRVTGTDGWSWDAPFVHTKERYAQTGDAGLIWEGHRAGMEIGYCHLEKLHNLEALPATGFLVSCFPFNIKGASAGFTRAVAIFED
jgi:kynurenine formamidase